MVEIVENDDEYNRDIVIPGDKLDSEGMRAGHGTFMEGNKIYSYILGTKNIKRKHVNILPLSGRYIPREGDTVIGVIIDVGATHWLVDINSPYTAPLHINDAPWQVDFAETSKYLNVGDVILAKVSHVDESMRVFLTMKSPNTRRLKGGVIAEISSQKVPRVIGKGGSMINLIKKYTKCRILVGQNGRIWISGNVDDIALVIEVLSKIEKEAHLKGLTDAITKYLEERKK